VNLFDPELKVQSQVEVKPGSRSFLLDLDAVKSSTPRLLASACKALPLKRDDGSLSWTVEGVGDTPAIVLLSAPQPPKSVTLGGQPVESVVHDAKEGLLYIRFNNTSAPRELSVTF